MPQVTMPDGAVVDMPDQLDPELGARLRAFHDAASAPKPRTIGSKIAEATVGPSELLASGIANVPGAAINAVSDIVHRIGGNDSAPPLVPSVPVGEAGRNLMGDIRGMVPEAIPNALHSADTALRNASPVAHDLVHGAGAVAGDVANILPVAGAVTKGASAIGAARTAAAAPVAVGDIPAALEAVGYRNLPSQGGGSTQAKVGASISGEGQLAGHQALTNQAVTDTLAKHEAGVAPEQALTHENIVAARQAGPAKVYTAAENALPQTLSQSDKLRGALASVGDTTSQLPKSPDVDALKQAMLAQPTMTRTELFANIAQAREKATAFYKSDLPDSHAMGDAYRGIANAYEDFAGDQLAANPQSPVSLADFQAARTAFAKNYAVDAATKGTSLQGSKFAALQQKDKDLLTGPSQLIAEQHNRFPLSSTFGPQTLPDTGVGAAGTVAGAAARHVTGPLIGGGIGAALGGPAGAAIGSGTGLLASAGFQNLIRRALAGSPEAGAAQAGEALGGSKLADFFNPPKPPEAPPAPLSLTPPPGQAFSPHQPALATGADTQRDFFGTGANNFPPPDAPMTGPPPLVPGHPGEIGLADLLSHGIEQRPAPGLSAGPMGAPASDGIPFRVDPGHAAGDLSLMDELLGRRGGLGNEPQDMTTDAHQRALRRALVGLDRSKEAGFSGELEPEPIPRNAALVEAEHAKIDAMTPAEQEDYFVKNRLPSTGESADEIASRLSREADARGRDFSNRDTPAAIEPNLMEVLAGRTKDIASVMHQGHAAGLEGDLMNLLSQTPGVPEDILQRSTRGKINKRDLVNMNASDLNTPTLAQLLGSGPHG